MSMSKENQGHYENLQANAKANILAADIVRLVDAEGGIFCTVDGMRLVLLILQEQFE